jgi:hypothetical protein
MGLKELARKYQVSKGSICKLLQEPRKRGVKKRSSRRPWMLLIPGTPFRLIQLSKNLWVYNLLSKVGLGACRELKGPDRFGSSASRGLETL